MHWNKFVFVFLIILLAGCSGVTSTPVVEARPTVTRLPPTLFPTAFTPVTPTITPTIPSFTPTSISSSIYVMLVLDASAAMTAAFDGKTKWDAARESAQAIMDGLDPGANYGLVVIGGSTPSEGVDPCNQPSVARTSFSARSAVGRQIDQLQPEGSGSLYSAFFLARRQFESLPANTVRALVVITDTTDECQRQDEWKGLENLSKVMDEAGLEFHSEIIVLDEADNYGLRFAADRIGIWSKRKIVLQFPRDFSTLHETNSTVVDKFTNYAAQILASSTATPVRSAYTLTADPNLMTDTPGASSFTLTPRPGEMTSTLGASSFTLTPRPGTATFTPTLTVTPVPRTETVTRTPTITRTPTATKPPFVELISSSYRTRGIGCQVNIVVKVSGSPATGSFHVLNSSNGPVGEVFQETTLPVGTYGNNIVSLSGDRPESYFHDVWFESDGIPSNRLTGLKCPFVPTATSSAP